MAGRSKDRAASDAPRAVEDSERFAFEVDADRLMAPIRLKSSKPAAAGEKPITTIIARGCVSALKKPALRRWQITNCWS
jgi:hypothetical protein